MGRGDYSSQWVSKVYVTYKKGADGKALKDKNGNYIIEKLTKSDGTIITVDGVPTTDLNAVFDQKTGIEKLVKEINKLFSIGIIWNHMMITQETIKRKES